MSKTAIINLDSLREKGCSVAETAAAVAALIGSALLVGATGGLVLPLLLIAAGTGISIGAGIARDDARAAR